MSTKVWSIDSIDSQQLNTALLAEPAQLLQQGRTIALPTETVYGLGADARNAEAVAAIFQAKGRPSDNPLIVHIADTQQLQSLVEPLSPLAVTLMDHFWPGPLTIVLPARPGAVAPQVTAGLSTVAVRMPQHPVALALIRAANCPVAAPSANRSGRPSPTTAAHVLEDLDGRIDGVVDGGACGIGVESTVVELVDGVVHILRPGGVTTEQLLEVVDEVIVADELVTLNNAPRSPGMKYTHYAPQGSMQLVQGAAEAVATFIQQCYVEAHAQGKKAAMLVFAEHAHLYRDYANDVHIIGRLDQLATATHHLYAALRTFDEQGVQLIWAETCPLEGLGHALMNRLRKAAGGNFMQV